MTAHFQDLEVTRLLCALAEIDGRTAVEVIERKFPRLGPAEPGTCYAESVRSFAPDDHVEPALLDADEIVITVRGEVGHRVAQAQDLRQWLDEALERAGAGDEWDARARLDGSTEDRQFYELTVSRTPHLPVIDFSA